MRVKLRCGGILSLWILACGLSACSGQAGPQEPSKSGDASANLEFILDGETISLPVIKTCNDGQYGAGLRAQEVKNDEASQKVLRWTGSPPSEDELKAVITFAVETGSYMASDAVSREGKWLVWSGEFTFLEDTETGTRKAGTATGSVKFKCNQ